MKKKSGVKLGITAGLIIGVLYMGLLMIRYTYFSYDPFIFILSSFINFALLLIALVFLAKKRKADLGGIAEIKEMFQPLFVAILLIEVICYLFNYYYLNYINPEFYTAYEQGLRNFAQARNLPKEQLDEKITAIREAAKDSSLFWAPMIGIFSRVVLDSIFAVIIAFVLRSRLSSEQMDIWRERRFQN